jgi:hypothetical protein
MQTLEWATVDKSNWEDGPWKQEPDKKQWLDEETGYPCLIHRSPTSGSLCGYVGVPESHPYFGKNYDDVDVQVHGGLTFADSCSESGDPSFGICHLVEPGENDRVWWLGFDTAHYSDYSPAIESLMSGSEIRPAACRFYRDLAYVEAEVKSLAQQLKALELENTIDEMLDILFEPKREAALET